MEAQLLYESRSRTYTYTELQPGHLMLVEFDTSAVEDAGAAEDGVVATVVFKDSVTHVHGHGVQPNSALLS